jgi:hypothetical protein
VGAENGSEVFRGSSKWTDCYRRARVFPELQLAEGFGELAAEPGVFPGEVPVGFAGGLQSVQQGLVASSLSDGNW